MSLPGGRGASILHPDSARSEPVATIVQRVRPFERDRIIAVELAVSTQRETGGAKSNLRAQRQRPAQSRGKVVVAVSVATWRAEAVDAGCSLPADRAGKGFVLARDGRGRACAGKPE